MMFHGAQNGTRNTTKQTSGKKNCWAEKFSNVEEVVGVLVYILDVYGEFDACSRVQCPMLLMKFLVASNGRSN